MDFIRYKINELTFEWHQEKYELTYAKRQISFEEVCSVFFDPNEITYEDSRYDYNEIRYITIGMSQRARLLVVSWTYRENTIRLITVIKAEKKHEQAYRR